MKPENWQNLLDHVSIFSGEHHEGMVVRYRLISPTAPADVLISFDENETDECCRMPVSLGARDALTTI
jgi:hypothetical protein